MTKATAKQLEQLAKYGIEAPVTKSSAKRMLTFIIEGNGIANDHKSKWQRVGILKAILDKYQDKRVSREDGTVLGNVKHVWPCLRSEIDKRTADVQTVAAFVCSIRCDDGKSRIMDLSSVRLVEQMAGV